MIAEHFFDITTDLNFFINIVNSRYTSEVLANQVDNSSADDIGGCETDELPQVFPDVVDLTGPLSVYEVMIHRGNVVELVISEFSVTEILLCNVVSVLREGNWSEILSLFLEAVLISPGKWCSRKSALH